MSTTGNTEKGSLRHSLGDGEGTAVPSSPAPAVATPTDADRLRAQIPSSTDAARLEQLARDDERRRLTAFARWIIQEMCFEGGRTDGGEVRDKAVELGLLVEIEGGWDPEKHDTEHWSSDYMEPGDPYFELADCLKAAASKPAIS